MSNADWVIRDYLFPVLGRTIVTLGDKGYIQETTGIHAIPFIYLGTKHMMMGLKRMGEIKTSLAEEAEADEAKITEAIQPAVELVETETVETAPIPSPKSTTYQNHEITFALAPDEGTEVKAIMMKGAKVDYIWETNGGKSNFDVHGDSKKLKISYHPYYKGSDSKREGILEAAFDGGHSWFWRNRTKQPLTITIKTNGEYTDIKRY